jgi:hypothetical protein
MLNDLLGLAAHRTFVKDAEKEKHYLARMKKKRTFQANQSEPI